MNSKYTKLAKNTLVFAIGTFGSKVLSFLIIPLYTYYLSTSEYGSIDLFTTSINMMVPFVTLMIQEASIRFMVTKEMPRKIILNNCMFIFSLGGVVSIALIPLYSRVLPDKKQVLFFVLLLLLTSYNTIFSQYLRACNKNVSFSVNGIIVTSVTVFSNVLLIVGLKFGVKGYLISLILAQAIASVQASISGRIFNDLSFEKININMLKQMLVYSIPLVPSNLMWWIMSAGDKYVINYFLGNSANGIYSIAMKIPTILSMMYTIFMQAWQLSALEESKSEERAEFYDKVFSLTAAFLLCGTSVIIFIVKFFFQKAISPNYFESWKYIPLLCVATIINCFAGFSGVTYTIDKNSKKAFYTTFIGAVTNLLFNFILIRIAGLFGVVIGTLLGYTAVFIIRARDAHHELKMNFDIRRIIPCFTTVILQAIFTNFVENILIFSLVNLVCLFIIINIYMKEIKRIVMAFINIFSKKRMKI